MFGTLALALLLFTLGGGAPSPSLACRESPIHWDPERRLTIADFRGPMGHSDFAAEASTGIQTEAQGSSTDATFQVTIQSYFDPCKSWMRPKERNAYTLDHEQLHFDITELFSRKLAARYAREIRSYKQYQREHDRIYAEVWAELLAMQSRYDDEVYGEPATQERWVAEVGALLARTPAPAVKVVTLPMR